MIKRPSMADIRESGSIRGSGRDYFPSSRAYLKPREAGNREIHETGTHQSPKPKCEGRNVELNFVNADAMNLWE